MKAELLMTPLEQTNYLDLFKDNIWISFSFLLIFMLGIMIWRWNHYLIKSEMYRELYLKEEKEHNFTKMEIKIAREYIK